MSGKVIGWDGEKDMPFDEQPGAGEHRYTVYLGYDHGPGSKPKGEKWSTVEEVDVNASSKAEAQRLVAEYAPENYEPGYEIIHVEGPRVGFYM